MLRPRSINMPIYSIINDIAIPSICVAVLLHSINAGVFLLVRVIESCCCMHFSRVGIWGGKVSILLRE